MVSSAWIYSIQFKFWHLQLHQHLHPHSTCHLNRFSSNTHTWREQFYSPLGFCPELPWWPDIISVLQQNRLRWYGHVLRKEVNDWVKKCMEYKVEGIRPGGRPKKTCREIVKKDCRACGLNTEDAMCRSKWRKQTGMIDDHDECSGWMFLLVPAHPGCTGQIPQSRKMVVCVCVYPGDRHQTGKTNLDLFTVARYSEWQWHQLGHMEICTSTQTHNHAGIPPISFYRLYAIPAAQPTASKHWRQSVEHRMNTKDQSRVLSHFMTSSLETEWAYSQNSR